MRRRPPASEVVPLPPARRWWDRAACKGWPLHVFFPPNTRGRTAVVPPEVAALCASCPVREDCLAEALGTVVGMDQGIWAGTTPSERRAMRAGRRAG